MPDELRSPIKHHLVLHRINPEQGVRRFYSLMIAEAVKRLLKHVETGQ